LFNSVSIDFGSDTNEDNTLRKLRASLRNGLQEFRESDLKRAVYVVRMCGNFVIAYKYRNSPVLYIGRGNCGQRLAQHLNNWMHQVKNFGENASVEMKICFPRRQRRENFFMNVEADLLKLFRQEFGSLPFFNKRSELKHAGKIKKYSSQMKREMRRAIMIGSGNKPQWALKPTRSNKDFRTFVKGEDLE
jgi:hypothetical protein